MNNQKQLIIRKEGRVGRITLNRPDSLNALSHKMTLDITQTLRVWSQDEEVSCVLVDATGDRAFCAGGDLTSFYEQSQISDYETGRQFWRDEYQLNYLIAHYPKPYIVIMSGFVMGGGVGLGIHGSHRIVTDTTAFALPECAVGLIPDVGSNYYLAKAPGYFGEFVGLTGSRLNASDTIYCGFADNYISNDNVPNLIDKLIKTGDVSEITKHAEKPKPSGLAALSDQISHIFGQTSLPEIIAMGVEIDIPIIQKAMKLMLRNSPLSLCVQFEVLKNVRKNLTIENAFIQEYRFVSQAVQHGDFIEGIRSAIIDKDKSPNWKYQNVQRVPKSALDIFKQAPNNQDLNLSRQ